MVITTNNIQLRTGLLLCVGLFLFVLAAIEHTVVNPACEGMMSNWETAEKSYDDDECVDAWDELTGGIKSMLSLDKFRNADRKSLVENKDATPPFDVCVKKAANYTLTCPPDMLEVTGCNGKKYHNACFAERDGIYSYITSNVLKATE